MARYFKEQDIDEYRECFYLYSRSGVINTENELAVIMRSLGMSPTIVELKEYVKSKKGKMNFADFLDIMHKHSSKENIPDELLDAFKGMDFKRSKTISAKDLKHVLKDWGEKLSSAEVERIFQEAGVNLNKRINYEHFIRVVCTPLPENH